MEKMRRGDGGAVVGEQGEEREREIWKNEEKAMMTKRESDRLAKKEAD